MSFIDDNDDTDDDRFTPISRLRRPMSSLNHTVSTGNKTGCARTPLYNRYQGLRSVSSLQRPVRTTEHIQRRSVSAMNDYSKQLDHQFKDSNPKWHLKQERHFPENQSTADIWDELNLVREKMQRMNVGTRSGRTTLLPLDSSNTIDGAEVTMARKGTFTGKNRTVLVPKKLRRRHFSWTGADSMSIDLTAAPKATFHARSEEPPLAPPLPTPMSTPITHIKGCNDLTSQNEVPVSASQQHLQSLLVRLNGRTDIDSLLLDRACADLLRVYSTTTTSDQREALDQVCLSMANFVIKTLDDRQQQQHQQKITQSELQYHNSQLNNQKLQRDPYRTPENNTSSSDSLGVDGNGEKDQSFEPNTRLGSHIQQRQQQQRQLLTGSPLF